MIDLKHYAALLGSNKEMFLKYLGKYKYSSLYALIKDMENISTKIEWIENTTERGNLISTCTGFAESLKNEQVSFKDQLDFVCEHDLDIPSNFPNLMFREGKYSGGECPVCNKKELYVPKHGQATTICCNRKNACGYNSSIYKYLKEHENKTSGEALKCLASYAGVDLEVYRQGFEVHLSAAEVVEKSIYVDKKYAEKRNVAPIEVQYEEFEETKSYQNIAISKYIPSYGVMNLEQKLKTIYTYMYQFSLQTNQKNKIKYYESRCINTNSIYVSQIGYLSTSDLKELIKHLREFFPLEDLIELGIIKIKMKNDIEVPDRNGNPIYGFKHFCLKGFCVIPSFDLYSNTVTGLKLRNIELAEWQPKSMKEPEMSRRDIVYPLPFGFNRDMLLDKDACIFMVEGHVDGLTLPVSSSKIGQAKIDYEKSNTYFIASPGTNGISQEILGLLKGKFICLCFDQDTAGRKGAYGEIKISYGEEKASFVNDPQGMKNTDEFIKDLEAKGIPFYKSKIKGMKTKLEQAGARVLVRHWDINLGGDVNELRENGNLSKVFNF